MRANVAMDSNAAKREKADLFLRITVLPARAEVGDNPASCPSRADGARSRVVPADDCALKGIALLLIEVQNRSANADEADYETSQKLCPFQTQPICHLHRWSKENAESARELLRPSAAELTVA